MASIDTIIIDGQAVSKSALRAWLKAPQFEGQALLVTGTDGAPGLAFSGDTNTGIFSPGADSIAWSIGGVEKMRLNSTGFGFGVTPALTFDIGGVNGLNVGLRSTGTAAAAFRGYVNGAEAGKVAFTNGGGIDMEVAGTLRASLGANGLTIVGSFKSSSYTVGTVPSASSHGAGANIYVSNEAGGAVPAFSDGSAWRRVTDRATIS